MAGFADGRTVFFAITLATHQGWLDECACRAFALFNGFVGVGSMGGAVARTIDSLGLYLCRHGRQVVRMASERRGASVRRAMTCIAEWECIGKLLSGLDTAARTPQGLNCSGFGAYPSSEDGGAVIHHSENA
jgi:hypothetical protein